MPISDFSLPNIILKEAVLMQSKPKPILHAAEAKNTMFSISSSLSYAPRIEPKAKPVNIDDIIVSDLNVDIQ